MGLLEIGTIGKAHGLRGEVLVRLVTNRMERLEPGSVLHAGERVLVVAAARPHQDRHLVRFEGVADRTAAEDLRGSVLCAEPIDDEGELWVHELVGAVVVDQHDVERGTVESVQANPASDLLVLDTGHLIPLVFVTTSDAGTVRVDVPDGLFDLSG